MKIPCVPMSRLICQSGTSLLWCGHVCDPERGHCKLSLEQPRWNDCYFKVKQICDDLLCAALQAVDKKIQVARKKPLATAPSLTIGSLSSWRRVKVRQRLKRAQRTAASKTKSDNSEAQFQTGATGPTCAERGSETGSGANCPPWRSVMLA